MRDFKVWEPSLGQDSSTQVRAFDAQQAAEEYSKVHHGNSGEVGTWDAQFEHLNEVIENVHVFDSRDDELTRWSVSVSQQLQFSAEEMTDDARDPA